MVGWVESDDLEPAWMPVAAFHLSVFDLKYGKFPRGGGRGETGLRLTEFSAVRAYTHQMEQAPEICILSRSVFSAIGLWGW